MHVASMVWTAAFTMCISSELSTWLSNPNQKGSLQHKEGSFSLLTKTISGSFQPLHHSKTIIEISLSLYELLLNWLYCGRHNEEVRTLAGKKVQARVNLGNGLASLGCARVVSQGDKGWQHLFQYSQMKINPWIFGTTVLSAYAIEQF